MKKAYCKLDLRSHPDKNNHPHASADFCMINKAKEVFEDALHYNDTMRRTQEIEEDLHVKSNIGEKMKKLGNQKNN